MLFTAEYEGVNSFLIGAANLLLENGVKRETRGYTCWELPAPFFFSIKNPTSRWITISERKWNVTLPYAESLWLASGRNDLDFVKQYVKKLADFSDDGRFIRGGYGPRFRFYNGISSDYENFIPLNNTNNPNEVSEVDQYKFVIECFNEDINTRRAIMNIGDPPKDNFDSSGKLKVTKDFPCTRLLHFIKDPINSKLNLTVYMRSNDFLWGASAVNIFNNTFIQEYFAKILNLEVGTYYHFVNNFHYYEEHKSRIKSIANIYETVDEGFIYEKNFNNIKEFDSKIIHLNTLVEELRTGKKKEFTDLEDDFFNDWFKVFYKFHTKRNVEFINPVLNQVIN